MRNLTRRSALALLGLSTLLSTGCGGGTEIEEGVPEDAAEEANAAYEQFKEMQGKQGKAMQKAEVKVEKEQ